MGTLVSTLTALILTLTFLNFAPAEAAQASSPAPATKTEESLKSGWEQKWDQLLASAKQEGKVVVYGNIGPLLKKNLVEGFQGKFGIEMEFVVGRPPEVATRYLQERTGNIRMADFLIAGQTTTTTLLKPKGVLARLSPQIILPEVLDLKAWPEGKLPFLDKEEMSLALISYYQTSVVINTELVKEGEVRSYHDFLNAKWKGKIILYDPSLPGAGGTWVAFTLLKAMGREAGENLMRQLSKHDLTITRDARLHAEGVARGKYAIGIGADNQAVSDFIRVGTPIAWGRMQEGGIIVGGTFVAALPDNAAHPSAAALLLNWILSKEGQQAVSQAAGEPARRVDVPRSGLLPGIVPQPGDRVAWADEEFILAERTFYPLSKEIFGLK